MELPFLHLLFFINAFDLTTENPISFYRFDVNIVERCPMNATEFERAARKRNCTGNNRYLCAPDRNLLHLIEFCTDTKRSLFEKGNCLQLEGTGDLNHHRCVERFVSGCPTEPYADDEIYKYPACLKLNRDFNCFVADKDCRPSCIPLTITEQYFNDSIDEDAIEKTKPETSDGLIKLDIVVIVCGFFAAIVIGSVAIHVYLYKRGKYRKDEKNEEENRRYMDEKSTIANDGFNAKKPQENSNETRENCDEKRRLIDDKCVIVGQIDANESKESETIDKESDRYRSKNEKEKYEYFWQKHSVFSQWYPCTFVVNGITYNCAGQYMVHQRAEIMGDEDSAEAIMTLDDPNEIKKRGRRVKNFNQDIWESCCQDIVKRGNMEKFSQNEELKQQLLWTYPKTLVEASPYDKIWGIGLSEDDPRAWNKLTWKGKNLLGEILTTVRERLRRDIENAGPYGNPNDLDL